jgi:hypothetical protein
MATDASPWAIETADGWSPPICEPTYMREGEAVELRCPLTEPTIEMPEMLGTFPGNLATSGYDAINHGPDGATIALSASGMGPPFPLRRALVGSLLPARSI